MVGDDFNIMASMGHIRDLPERELGVDIENNFAPEYVVLKDKKEVVMVGDRKFDIIGANYHNLDSIGVLYGYGNHKEFTDYNATYIAKFRPDREYLYLNLDFLDGCSGYETELISGSLYDNSYTKFYPNSKIKITARAENGYEFAFWEDGSTENPRNIHIIDDDVTAYAVFQKSIGSNVYIGNVLYDIYRGDKLMDVYVGNILI